ncbi:hypothetical protein LDL76_00745 [Salegentibacter mishustinae]|uniref:hypothetical protein n=1 Tax=Salegentibacter mishustinae TaxID=270918 RepID=UPI001CE031B4|nr:hypothetical protein [Salegentibacter mishustinae]UBZ07254.1 hypothetical protein LDL76_00745 [Salegentibacter mishustinae]
MAEIFNEVRKAYRILFDYQSRILDLMDFIEKTYAIPFSGGFSKFSATVPKKGKLNLWGWDWLPMYYYEFFFEKRTEDYHLRFSAFLLNDSGFYDAEKDKKGPEKLNIESFNKAEFSTTKLILLAGKNCWWEQWGKREEDLPGLGNSGKAEQGELVYKSYDLERFGTEDEALETLKDFSTFCKKNNIPLEISERKISE